MSVMAYWQQYSAQFNARNLRERIIIVLCVLAAIAVIWDFAFMQGVSQQRKTLAERYQLASEKLATLSNQEKALISALASNPLLKKQQEALQLKQRLTVVDQKIEDLSVGLIAPDKLPLVIRDLVTNLDNVELLGLKSLEPEPFLLEQTGAESQNESVADNTAEAPNTNKSVDFALNATGRTLKSEESTGPQIDDIGVFKHRVVFRLRGQYRDIFAYLAQLEDLKWHFYWSEMRYLVDGYPEAIVQLEAYTLSTGKGFISE